MTTTPEDGTLPLPRTQQAAGPSAWVQWRLSAALIALTLVPMAGGAIRLSGLTGGAAVTPANARFVASPQRYAPRE